MFYRSISARDARDSTSIFKSHYSRECMVVKSVLFLSLSLFSPNKILALIMRKRFRAFCSIIRPKTQRTRTASLHLEEARWALLTTLCSCYNSPYNAHSALLYFARYKNKSAGFFSSLFFFVIVHSVRRVARRHFC